MSTSGDDPPLPRNGLAIKEASELLGVPAPTLRSWELRYGLPTTIRTLGGHRRYDHEALNQLRLMRDEIAIGRSAAAAALWVRGILDENNPARGRILAVLAASKQLDPIGIRVALDLAHDQLGLAAALDVVVLPAMRQIGAWWEKGSCDVGREHFTTEVVRGWLARMIAVAPPARSDRWALLAVGPRDLHTLGIEALAAILVHQGIGCRVLGPRTSTRVLVTASVATSAGAVVVVSHLATQRRPAVESLAAVAETGCPVFYAGNAFLFPALRKGVPGTYLGASLTGAAGLIRASNEQWSG